MAAAGLAFRAELRQRWRAWRAVALLIAVVGGVTLSLVAAGRRTASAYPGFVAATRGIDAVVYNSAGFSPPTVRIRGVAVDALAERSYQGALLEPPIIAGHAPAGPRQIVLGDTTLRQVGAQVGERVPVTVGGRTVPFTVVGTAVFPDFGVSGGLGTGAGMTFPGYLSAAGCGTGSSAAGCYADGIVITLAPGTGRAGALARLETAYRNGAVLPAKPTTLVNFGQVADLPLILGLAVALFGSGTQLHFLLVSAARRRREVGTLKALGFVRRQVAAAVAWQSIAVVVVAIALGMPLGIAAGRLGWDLAASSFGVVDQIAIPCGSWRRSRQPRWCWRWRPRPGPLSSRPACARPRCFAPNSRIYGARMTPDGRMRAALAPKSWAESWAMKATAPPPGTGWPSPVNWTG
jgi:hypothetical protein